MQATEEDIQKTTINSLGVGRENIATMKQEQSIKREQITRKNFKKRKICQPKGEAQWDWKNESKKSLLRKEMMKEKY